MNNILTVRVASTTNLTDVNHNGFCMEHTNPPSQLILDGIAPVVGNWVLIKNQTDKMQNGLYQVARVGTTTVGWKLDRRQHAGRLKRDLLFYTVEGTDQNGCFWRITNADDPITSGFTELEFDLGNLSTDLLCVSERINVPEICEKVTGDGICITGIDVEGNPTNNGKLLIAELCEKNQDDGICISGIDAEGQSTNNGKLLVAEVREKVLGDGVCISGIENEGQSTGKVLVDEICEKTLNQGICITGIDTMTPIGKVLLDELCEKRVGEGICITGIDVEGQTTDTGKLIVPELREKIAGDGICITGWAIEGQSATGKIVLDELCEKTANVGICITGIDGTKPLGTVILDKVLPKGDFGVTLDHGLFFQRFGIGRIHVEGAGTWPIPLNTPTKIPDFVQTFEGNFGDIVLKSDGMEVRHFLAPIGADLPNCPFNCIYIDVCVAFKLEIVAASPGDVVTIQLCKGTIEGVDPVISELCHTIHATIPYVEAGPAVTQTISFCETVKLLPGDYIDVVANTTSTGTINILGGTTNGFKISHASFKICGFDPIIV